MPLPDFTSFHPGYEEEKREAERRQTQCFMSCTQAARGSRHGEGGLRRPHRCRARSPAGVPPRLSPRGVFHPQGATRARLRGYGASSADIAANAAPSSSEAPRTPVLMPAGMMPGPPGSRTDEVLPAGTALAPFRPASPGRRPFRASLILCLYPKRGRLSRHGHIYRDAIIPVRRPFSPATASRRRRRVESSLVCLPDNQNKMAGASAPAI